MMADTELNPTSCPLVLSSPVGEQVLLAHGEGGRMMRRLIRERIQSRLPVLPTDRGDACDVGRIDGPVVLTTDSYVVSPLFFPGGDIGSLAVYGTVNDLAVAGAEPMYLTLSLILEEGLEFAILDRVLQSIAAAAQACGVRIVTGDTKVVPHGAADGLFINTCGLGRLPSNAPRGPRSLQAGDLLIASGPIGRHGVAVMAARENLGFTPAPTSDSAPLHRATLALQAALGGDLRAMRDATRGGVAAVMHEWAEESGLTIKLYESKLPVSPEVRGVCELLGLDPIYVPNEGTFMAAVSARSAQLAMEVLQRYPETLAAKVVGEVGEGGLSPVVMERLLGHVVAVDEPAGAPLPRIC